MDGHDEFLFGVANNIDRLTSKSLRLNGIMLTVCGFLSMIAAAVACALEAVKSFQMHNYMNTHWITTVFFYTGLSLLCMERYKLNFMLFLCVGLLLVSVPVAVTSFIFDCINIDVARNFNVTKFRLSMPDGVYKISVMQLYSGFDLLACMVAFVFSVHSLWKIRNLSCRYFASVPHYKSKLLLFLGCMQGVIGTVKCFLWLFEFTWLRSMGENARFLFINYTLDEPIWNSIYVIIGATIIIIALKGTKLLMYVAVVLVPLSAYPCVIYLWIDYRWYMNRKTTEMTMHLPKQLKTLETNIGLGVVHLFLILATVVHMIRSINKGDGYLYKMNCNIDKGLRKILFISSFLLVVAGIAFLIIDIENVIHHSFYRVFHATDQKLPFFLLCGGVLGFYLRSEKWLPYFLPTCFLLMLMCAQTSIFPIAAYIFLSYNAYFGDRLCAFFYWGNVHCNLELEASAAMSHFFESGMAAAVLLLTVFVAFLLARLMSMHELKITQLDYGEERKKRLMERGVLALGIFQLGIGLSAVIVSLVLEAHSFSAIYRTCLSITLIIYPTVQILFSLRGLLQYPLLATSLCLIGMIRFIEIIIQLDYRQLGSAFQMSWTILTAVEMVCMVTYFATIVMCSILLDMGLNRLPQFEFVDYNPEDGQDKDNVSGQEDKDNATTVGADTNSSGYRSLSSINTAGVAASGSPSPPSDPWAI